MKTRGLATPKHSSDYIYDDPVSESEAPEPISQQSALYPLVQCPACPKSFNLLRSLYGHYGRSHANARAKYHGTKLNHDKILYGCPYCKVEGVEFTTLEKVKAHVRTCHEECVLLLEKSQGVSPDRATSGVTLNDSTTAATFPSETSPETNEQKSRNLASHPLGKCPCCPKILLLRGIFGHFGRAHCGIQFDWDQVQYLCPFCEDTGDEEPTMYASFDETRAHVELEHEGCYLVPIGPSRIAQAGQSPPIGKVKVETCAATAVRSSQRRRTSAASVDEGETVAESIKSSSQTMYQCPSCERTFNKQGLSTHYGMVHGKKLNWDNVKIAEYEGRAYICPECDRTFTKTGLYTHYGMVHDGKLEWDIVRIVNGGDGFTLKRQRGVIENADREEDEEEEEDDGPVRKSRRISARASRVVEEEESDFVSYDPSPTNMAAAAPAKSSKQPPGLNFGPWTPEEHEAFMLGHTTYGNEWKRISTDFVPTRTPKQIGSHALAYFTTKGMWEGRNGMSVERSTNEHENVTGHKVNKSKPKMEEKLVKERKQPANAKASTAEMHIRRTAWSDEEHAAFIKAHKKLGNSWLLISKLYVPSKTPKQIGSHALHHFSALGKWEEAKKSKRDPSLYEDVNDMDESPSSTESDDGNFDYCVVCEDGGDLICCSECPRSFHRSCIDNPSSILSANWSCERCRTDFLVLPEEELPMDISSTDVQALYSNLVYSEGFEQCCNTLTTLNAIVSRLKDSDHGYIFAEPVDLSIVPDYVEKVRVPMDYGTIQKKLGAGEYMDILKPLMKRPMESVLLHVIHDIETVHKNCATYNPKGSSVYRAGISQSRKWAAYFKKYIVASLPDMVTRAYQNGMLDTEHELRQGHQSPSPKKSKRSQITPSSSIVLSEEQFVALENLFFSRFTDLHDLISPTESMENNDRHSVTQWFEKLEDLRQYKLLHGTAVVTIAQDDKLYQWIIRQRKRYHLTLHHKPEFTSERYTNSNNLATDNSKDVRWLINDTASPSRKKKKIVSGPPAPKEKDLKAIATDISSSKAIQRMHQQTLYYPSNSSPPYRHSSSVFFDECLEELRFFRGEHKHTLVPRSFPFNENLSLWVEIQRAKLLLQLVGFNSGLLGVQMNILDDELRVSDFTCSHLAAAEVVSSQDHKMEEDEADDFDEIHDVGENENVNSESADVSPVTNDVLDIVPLEVKSSPSAALKSIAEDKRESSETNETKNSRVPLCKCTGHFGSAHARIKGIKIITDDVLYGCPFCEDDLFRPMVELKTHIKDFHPNCILAKSEYKSTEAAKKVSVKASRPNIKAKPSAPIPLKKPSVFKRHLTEFRTWYQEQVFPNSDTMSKDLYAWCWKQCNGASALLAGTPNVANAKLSMNGTRLKLLANDGFFRVFSYNDKGMIYEDDYEGSEEWDTAFNRLQSFSITHGTTLVPSYFHSISPNTQTWIAQMHDELTSFVKGEHCELSVNQIEQLIMIGFCIDRGDLPNLTRSDVIWFKRFRELRQYQLVIGDCHITEDFPQLRQWVNEQKKLFRQFRTGNKSVMKIERVTMMMEAGVDFFTADYLPHLTQGDLIMFEEQISTPSHLFQGENDAGALLYPSDSEFDDDDFQAKFKSMKAINGHSLVLADENLDVYQWFIAMRSALLDSYASRFDTDHGCLFRSLVLSYVNDDVTSELNMTSFKTKECLITWTKYCERFMMFLAVKGHSHIPEDYPDIALLQWLAKQQDEIHAHCSKYPKRKLPLHLKVLVSLGVTGKKRYTEQPQFSSRIFSRRGPMKSKSKKVEK